MKKRYLRTSIQRTIEVVTFAIVGFLCMLEDFTIEFIPTLLVVLAVAMANTYVLVKYGKGY